MVKNNQNLVFKNVIITKISKTFDFYGQKSQNKNFHVFVGAFIWNYEARSTRATNDKTIQGRPR